MSTTSLAGLLGFAPQPDKGESPTEFYRHYASSIDLSTLSDDRVGPPEVGDEPTPTIPYRAGVLISGGFAMNPRMEDVFGWLAYGLLGAVETTVDKNILGTTAAGANLHQFKFDTDPGFVPWMTFYKKIPSLDTTKDLLETYTDCKLVGATINFPNDGLINARFDVIGRIPALAVNTAPTWDNAFEDYQSIPIGSVINGYMTIPGYSATEMPIIGATVQFSNGPLPLQQERVYGSPYLYDITPVLRVATVQCVVKWEDPEMYQAIMTGTTSGTAWTPAPFVHNFDIVAYSPHNIGATTSPYAMRIRCASVMWQASPVVLAGNNAVMMQLTGTALRNAGEYITLDVCNDTTAYTWPS